MIKICNENFVQTVLTYKKIDIRCSIITHTFIDPKFVSSPCSLLHHHIYNHNFFTFDNYNNDSP